jgi:hypothetical protein
MKCGDVRASTGEQAAAGPATWRMIGALGAEFTA